VGDTLRKVQPGSPLRIPAATFNAFIDAAGDFEARSPALAQGAAPAVRGAGHLAGRVPGRARGYSESASLETACQSPKHKARNPKRIPNPERANGPDGRPRPSEHSTLQLGICLQTRVSGFEIEVALPLSAASCGGAGRDRRPEEQGEGPEAQR
jgi:hypothetical protein